MKYVLMMCVLLVPVLAHGEDDDREGGSTPPAKPVEKPKSGPGVDYMPYGGGCVLF